MKSKQPKVLVFAIMTTLAILTWVSFEAYTVLNKRDLQSVPQGVMAPLVPTLDTETLKKLEGTTYFERDTSE